MEIGCGSDQLKAVAQSAGRMAEHYSSNTMVGAMTQRFAAQVPSCRASLKKLTNSAGFKGLDSGRQVEVLERAQRTGCSVPFLKAATQLVAHPGYAKLSPGHRRIVLDTLSMSKRPMDTAKAQRTLLGDLPFGHASSATRGRVLSKPMYYASRSMALLTSKSTRLPTKNDLLARQWRYMKYKMNTGASDNHVVQAANSTMFTNMQKLHSYFLSRWYEPAKAGRLVGEQYAELGGSHWWHKLEGARRQWTRFVSQQLLDAPSRRDTLPYGSACDK